MLGGGYFGQYAPGESGVQEALERVLTLILHLEEGVTGGTVLSAKVVSLPGRTSRVVLPGRNTNATLPGRVTVTVLPGRSTQVSLPARSTQIDDRWLTSP